MNNAPSVSVVIIFLNAGPFLAEAIESVFAQTYDDWELLLVNDGSTDGSAELGLRYAAARPDQVRYFTHPGRGNRGMSASRNLGIEHARGQYVAFLDADDVWLPQKLTQQVALLEAHPQAALVYGPVQWWHDWTGRAEDAGRNFIDRLSAAPATLNEPPHLVTALLRRETATSTNSLVRRDAALQVGGFETSFGGMYEDQAFFAKMCLMAPAFVAAECWYKWRKHPESCCARSVREGAYLTARRRFLRWLEVYMREQKINDKAVWTALSDAQTRVRQAQREEIKQSLIAPVSRRAKAAIRAVARATLPVGARRTLLAWWRGAPAVPPVGAVRMGDLRRLTPISTTWGYDRGYPVDRYYIERFLAARAVDVRGRVLEIAENTYTMRFGGDRVTQSDVLHAVAGNAAATFVADLTDAPQIPSDAYDCIICTQTLLVIYDVRAALATLHRILKPGGVLLVTVPGGCHQIARDDMEQWGDYWRFTSLSVRRLFGEFFPADHVTVETSGNVLTAISFLHGLAQEELTQAELDYHDPNYEVSIAVRATKPDALQSRGETA